MDDEELARRTAWALPDFPDSPIKPPRWVTGSKIAAALAVLLTVGACALTMF